MADEDETGHEVEEALPTSTGRSPLEPHPNSWAAKRSAVAKKVAEQDARGEAGATLSDRASMFAEGTPMRSAFQKSAELHKNPLNDEQKQADSDTAVTFAVTEPLFDLRSKFAFGSKQYTHLNDVINGITKRTAGNGDLQTLARNIQGDPEKAEQFLGALEKSGVQVQPEIREHVIAALLRHQRDSTNPLIEDDGADLGASSLSGGNVWMTPDEES